MDKRVTTSKIKKSKVSKAITAFGIGLVIGIGMATVTTVSAHSGGYVSDGNGNVVRDGSGNCVRADLGNHFPECEPQLLRAQKITKPVPPVKVVKVKPKPPIKMVMAKPKPKPKPIVKPKPRPKMVTRILTLNETAGANFGFDKDDLTNNAKQQLSMFATSVKNSNIKPSDVSVIGYTDSIGSENYNQNLSERRANSVANYLSTQGVDRRLMNVSGKGELQPVATNTTKEGRAQNRRVDVRVMGKKAIKVRQ